jgi:hypothetical protein
MPKLVDVHCPACGAPLRIDRDAPFALCGYCRTQSRIERVKAGAATQAPTGEPVIRLVVKRGSHLVLMSLGVAALLVLALFAALAVSSLAPSATDALSSEAVFFTDLSREAQPLDGYDAVAALSNGLTVVGSGSGRLALLDATGRVSKNVELPLPVTRARLRGLAPDRAGGFYASLGGAIIRVQGELVRPAVPSDPSRRVYGTIAIDGHERLHAITERGELARVGSDGLPQHSVRLGLPTEVSPLEVRAMAFGPDGRLAIAAPHGGRVWWFEPSRETLTPIPVQWERLESTVACLPDGSLVFDVGQALMRLSPLGQASRLKLTRPGWLTFHAVASDGAGGIVALSMSGSVARYDAARIGK